MTNIPSTEKPMGSPSRRFWNIRTYENVIGFHANFYTITLGPIGVSRILLLLTEKEQKTDNVNHAS
jgi:hypothetical protein